MSRSLKHTVAMGAEISVRCVSVNYIISRGNNEITPKTVMEATDILIIVLLLFSSFAFD